MADLGSTTTSFSVPQHPLPDEIQKMERDETVCKFCGVSYLIHNEVKALQERLAKAEKTMEYYKGSIEREKVLKEKLGKMDVDFLKQSEKLMEQAQQLELFKSDLKMKASLINEMYSQKRKTESDLREAQSKSEKLRTQISRLSAVLPVLSNLVRQQKVSLNSLKKEAIQQQVLSKKNIKLMRNDLGNVIHTLAKKVQNEKRVTELKWKDVNDQLLKSKLEIKNLRVAGSQLNDLQTKSGDLENKLIIYEKHVKQLEDENKTLRGKNKEVEKDLNARSSEETKIRTDLETLQSEKQCEVLKHQETISKKDEEIKKLNALCKSLEKLMNEKSAAEMEVRQKATGQDKQLQTLEDYLTKAKEESQNLKLERERTVSAHHNRIEQLRDSYVKKLGDSDKSCGQLQKELNKQREELEKNFEESKLTLRETFEKERKTMKEEYEEQLRTIQTEVKHLNEKLGEETRHSRNFKEEIHTLKNALSTNKTTNAQEVQKYQDEVLDLKSRLDAIQKRLRNEDNRKSSDEIAGIKRKSETVQKSLQNANAQIRLLEQQLTTTKDEMIILQDTVCRECEERLELTQALSDARMKLLTRQHNPGAPPHPPITKPAHRGLINRSTVTNISDLKITSSSEDATSVVRLGHERKVKSTGSDTPRPTRESVDCFRERIAAALGRQSRANHTR